jgi:protein ImuB
VLLEVQASLRYFGGHARLLRRLRVALASLGHRVHIASAPTPLGAALLAQWRDGFAEGPHASHLPALQQRLDEAPVWLLGPGREHWEALQGMGLQTLADLRRLPRAGLARRFGEGLLDDLDRACGQRADPRQALVPAAVFESRIELFTRADTSAQVLHGAGLLLVRLVAWARAQQARIGAFTLQMRHEPRHRGEAGDGGEATALRIELAEPSLDPEHLQLLLRERLANMVLAAPTLELQLDCRDLVRSAPPNGELFPTRQSQAQGLTRLLERLRARLGEAQVLRVVPVADHRPERATALQPVLASLPAHARLAPTALPLHRPVWLLPMPLPLAERGELPLLGGRPLQLLSGPERIESGWWDGALVARDYFIAQVEGGALVWIYRARLLPTEPGAQWFLQGRFG